MDRKRHLAALTGLGEVQQLQVAAARAELADALDELVTAEEATGKSRQQLQMSETAYEETLAAASFDPDAMRRAGFAILMSEDRLEQMVDTQRRAEIAQVAARAEWHGHRMRLRAVGEQRRHLRRKLVQMSEDKAAIDIMALAASRRTTP